MHDHPRRYLHDLVRAHGSGLCEDVTRCRQLLEQQCGSFPTEVSSLLAAQQQGVARELRSLPALPDGDWAGPLARRVAGRGELAEKHARWAVYSWAVALDKVQEAPYVPLESLRRAGRRDRAARSEAAFVGAFFGALAGVAVGAVVAWLRYPDLFLPGWVQWIGIGAGIGMALGTLAGWRPDPRRS
jgi:hypothetical protein